MVGIDGMAVSATDMLVGAALVVGMLTAWLWSRRSGPAGQLSRPLVGRVLLPVLLGLLGARIGFVLHHWERYQSSPLALFQLHDGGYSRVAGMATAVAVAIVLLWRDRRFRRALGVTFGAMAVTLLLGTGAVVMARRPISDMGLPAGTYATIDGAAVRFDALRGKPLVINLWASWCPPCRKEMPNLRDAQQQRSDVVFVFADQGEDMDTVDRYLDEQGLHLFNVVLDAKRAIAQQAHSQVLPTTLFFDAQGRLQEMHRGELTPQALQEKLARIAPAKSPQP